MVSISDNRYKSTFVVAILFAISTMLAACSDVTVVQEQAVQRPAAPVVEPTSEPATPATVLTDTPTSIPTPAPISRAVAPTEVPTSTAVPTSAPLPPRLPRRNLLLSRRPPLFPPPRPSLRVPPRILQACIWLRLRPSRLRRPQPRFLPLLRLPFSPRLFLPQPRRRPPRPFQHLPKYRLPQPFQHRPGSRILPLHSRLRRKFPIRPLRFRHRSHRRLPNLEQMSATSRTYSRSPP